MPIVSLEKRGIDFEYEDSGIPPDSTNYTTVFLIHPFLFNPRIFLKLFPYAASHNLRFIAPYLRQYGKTTPFTEEELVLLWSEEQEEQEACIHAQTLEFADLIAHFIEHEPLPPPAEFNGVRSGGVSILSWSAGCTLIMSLLANLDTLEEGLSNLLERNIHTVVINDPPCMCYGIPEPNKLYHPFHDTSLTREEASKAMMKFILSYYEPFDDLENITIESVNKRKTMAEADPNSKRTITTFTPQEMSEIIEPEIVQSIGPWVTDWYVYAENARRALLDTRGYWKDVRVVATWGSMTCWSTLWGTKAFKELLDEDPEEAQRREMVFVRLEGNHLFLHDMPEDMVRFIAKYVP